MQKFLIFILFITFSTLLNAQSYQQTSKKGLPPFSIMQANGSYFKAADLRKDQPVMLVYFDPDCDHCAVFIQELLSQINRFSQVQIILVTYVPVQSVKKFVEQTDLNQYPFVKVGTEGTAFIVRYHYNVIQFPYIAIHDKNGHLMATYESEVPTIETLAALLNE